MNFFWLSLLPYCRMRTKSYFFIDIIEFGCENRSIFGQWLDLRVFGGEWVIFCFSVIMGVLLYFFGGIWTALLLSFLFFSFFFSSFFSLSSRGLFSVAVLDFTKSWPFSSWRFCWCSYCFCCSVYCSAVLLLLVLLFLLFLLWSLQFNCFLMLLLLLLKSLFKHQKWLC